MKEKSTETAEETSVENSEIEKAEEKRDLTPAERAEADDILGECLMWACAPRGGNNFYGRVLNGCGRRAQHGLGTCGVTLDRRGHYMLLWDPAFILSIPEPMRLIVIVHEAGHLVLQHLERTLRLRMRIHNDEKLNKLGKVFNVAADMAVNDVAVRGMVDNPNMKFHEHRDQIIWPEDRGYPKGKSFEDYLQLLLNDLKDHGWDPDNPEQGGMQGEKGEDGKGAGGGEGEGEGDDYPGWFKDLLSKAPPQVDWESVFDDMTDGETERALDRAKRESKRITKSAVEQTQKTRGTIPGSMQKAIDDLLEEPTIPWQQVLQGMLKSEISQNLIESTAQPSVSLLHIDGYEPFPGFQHDFTFKIMAAFDTSGSMSDDDFRDCCAELQGILRDEEGVHVRLIMFDHAIQHEEELGTEDSVEMKNYGKHRYGYGGTSFEPVLRYSLGADEEDDWVSDAERVDSQIEQPDLVLLFTDGYAPIPLPELAPQAPLIWVLTEDGREDKEMQQVLRMKT